jgi:signal transduction histidine kinase
MEKARLVIIDDDIATITMLTRLLADQYYTTFAQNGAEGLKLIRSQQPDLILLDMNLPGESGLDVCREVKSHPFLRDIPVIFLTGEDEPSVIINAFEAGAADFITKPYQKSVLQTRIRVQITLTRQLKDLVSIKEQLEDEIEVRTEVERELLEKRQSLEQEIALRKKSEEELNRYAEALEAAKAMQEQTTVELYYANENIRNVLVEKEGINNELSRSNMTKDRLFSVISHDLKGGVGNISTVLDLICSERLAPTEQAEFLSELRKSAHSLYDLLEEILLWSRQQRDMIRYSPDGICLRDLIVNSTQAMRGVAEQKLVTIEKEVDSAITAYADHFMILSVLRNLIHNAIKFTPAHGLVRVGAMPDPNSPRHVLLYVRDTGTGIRDEDKPKIFQDGVLFTTRGTENESGTGLGLGICREFVNRNSGEIWFESKWGEGTVFWIRLQVTDQKGCQ